jgi:PAS domain S-box-containing protein
MKSTTQEQLLLELENLRARLDEAEDTLRAIRSGEVDAIVVSGAGGEQVYTLKGADHSYRVLIEDMNEGALTLSLDGIILYCNRCFAEMLKSPIEKIIGSKIHTWIASGSQSFLHELLQEYDTRTNRRGEATLLAGDGTLVPGYLSGKFIPMEETQELICLVVTDLTEQKRTEAIVASEKLAQQLMETSNQSRLELQNEIEEGKRVKEMLFNSERQYHLLFDEMFTGFAVHEIICDQSGTPVDYRFLSVNKAFEKMTGLDASDILGKTVLEVIPGTEFSWIERYGKVALTGEPTQFENYAAALGKHYEVHAYCPEHGMFAVLISDITERKRAEEAIRESELKFRRLFEHMTEGVALHEMIYDESGFAKDYRILDINSAYQKHTGLAPESARGLLASALYGMAAPPYLEEYENVARTGEPYSVETYFAPMEKQFRIIVFSPKRGFFATVFEDISERKRAGDKLRGVMEDLDRSNKDLEQFASIASHDLQEPLRMIGSYTQLLAKRYEGQLDEKAKEYIAYVVEGAARMQRLVNDLLTYSRAGTRGNPLETSDSHIILVEAIENLAILIEESKAIVTIDVLPIVSADASQLVQVFQNLLANAIKFRGKDIPRIHVCARDAGHEWVFSIRDNGIGIDRKYADKIFVIFQRLHAREEYPGTGIGLAVCKRIVERRGGRIWFESEIGKGSTFFFTIPR